MLGFSKRAKPKKDESPEPPLTAGQKFWKGLKGWIVAFAMAFAILGPIRSSVADWNDVPTGSMEPTILPGDRIFVNKLAYGLRVPFTKMWVAEWGKPRIGDIVTFFSPENGQRLVKRIVAGPGDTIELRDNHLYVNHTPVEYGPAPAGLEKLGPDPRWGPREVGTEFLPGRSHAVMATPGIRHDKRSFAPITVPEGQYFMMGDNRDQSRDSRYFEFVPRSRISGRSPMVALSVNPQKYYMPRLDRFFMSLR